VDDYTDTLRRLSIRDDAYVESLADDQTNVEASGFVWFKKEHDAFVKPRG